MFLSITDVFDYLRFKFKTQDFVTRLLVKAKIKTQKCKREVRSYN